jgi:hypothetical protein
MLSGTVVLISWYNPKLNIITQQTHIYIIDKSYINIRLINIYYLMDLT